VHRDADGQSVYLWAHALGHYSAAYQHGALAALSLASSATKLRIPAACSVIAMLVGCDIDLLDQEPQYRAWAAG